ncbi:MAG: hypothetical protein Q7J82_06730 [Coriobacteriia bacterium]|nr:hypothetical protein [Coriobacteriia bacterium]
MRRKYVRGAFTALLAAALVAPAAAYAAAAVTRSVEGVVQTDDTLFPAEVEEEGVTYKLGEIEWVERIVTDRTVRHSVAYDFGAQIGEVEIPETCATTYYDAASNTTVRAVLTFARVQKAAATIEGERELFTHVSYDPKAYELVDALWLPYGAPAPLCSGVEVEAPLLDALHYDPTVYHVTSSEWISQATLNGDRTERVAEYTVSRRAVQEEVVYSGMVALPDVLVFDGTATYAPLSLPERAERAVRAAATVATSDPWSILPWAAAGLAAGTALLGAIVFFRRRKRRSDDEDEEDEHED